jgi:hypothetical protein
MPLGYIWNTGGFPVSCRGGFRRANGPDYASPGHRPGFRP